MTIFTPRSIPTTAFGEVLAAQNETKISLRFDYAINARSAATTTTGSGTVTHSAPFAVCGTGTTTGSTAKLESRDILKYSNGIGLDMRGTVIFDTPIADTFQYIGLGNTTDGWAFGYSGLTFGVFRFKGGVSNFTAQASWNVDPFDGTGPSGSTLDQTKGNVIRITAQYLGFGDQIFSIESDTNNPGFFQIAHRIDYTNLNTDTSINNPSLPVFMMVDNGTTTSDIEIKSASFSGAIQGIDHFTGPRFAESKSQSGVTTEVNVLTIRNIASNVLGGTNTNRTPVLLDHISVSSDGPKISSIRVYLDATVTGATYTDTSTNESVIEWSNTNGAITGGSLIVPIEIGKAASNTTNLHDLDILFYPGEQITVSALAVGGGAGNDISVGLSWKELY